MNRNNVLTYDMIVSDDKVYSKFNLEKLIPEMMEMLIRFGEYKFGDLTIKAKELGNNFSEYGEYDTVIHWNFNILNSDFSSFTIIRKDYNEEDLKSTLNVIICQIVDLAFDVQDYLYFYDYKFIIKNHNLLKVSEVDKNCIINTMTASSNCTRYFYLNRFETKYKNDLISILTVFVKELGDEHSNKSIIQLIDEGLLNYKIKHTFEKRNDKDLSITEVNLDNGTVKSINL